MSSIAFFYSRLLTGLLIVGIANIDLQGCCRSVSAISGLTVFLEVNSIN